MILVVLSEIQEPGVVSPGRKIPFGQARCVCDATCALTFDALLDHHTHITRAHAEPPLSTRPAQTANAPVMSLSNTLAYDFRLDDPMSGWENLISYREESYCAALNFTCVPRPGPHVVAPIA